MRTATLSSIQDAIRRLLGSPVQVDHSTGNPKPVWFAQLFDVIVSELGPSRVRVTQGQDYISIVDVDDRKGTETRIWFDLPASTVRVGRFIDGQEMGGLRQREPGAPNREEALIRSIVNIMLAGRTDAERAAACEELLLSSDRNREDLLRVMLDERMRDGIAAAPKVKPRRKRRARVAS